MAISNSKPTSAGRRNKVTAKAENLSQERPLKKLLKPNPQSGGRNHGRVSVRHRGGGVRRQYRLIDFSRSKHDVSGNLIRFEYDPNRGVKIGLVVYSDGDKRYILAPDDLSVGDVIIAGSSVELRSGNALPLRNIPIGMPIHNLELIPGRGGQLVRGAGTAARITAKEGDYAHVQLPSGEIRMIPLESFATIGRLSNIDRKTIRHGKAGINRHLGIRPTVRGVAMSPRDHPHGGGEGRSSIGLKAAKTPWGKRTLGVKTRKRRTTDHYIVKRRK